MSIDGVGAYDLISRNAPFVRCFYGSPSTYLWEDEMGVTQSFPQGEGGEQGGPLMPMSFALGQHRTESDPGKDEARRTRDGVLG